MNKAVVNKAACTAQTCWFKKLDEVNKVLGL